MATDAKTKTVHITRIFDAPREKVWKAWTDPTEVRKWWGPKDFTAPSAKVDFRVGGKFLYCMRGPAGSEWDKDMYSGGEYKEIVPMKKIVATDHFADEKGNVITPAEMGMPGDWPTDEMLVTITFEDAGPGPESGPSRAKTKLTLKHEGHPAEMASDATQGWNQSLDKFAAALA